MRWINRLNRFLVILAALSGSGLQAQTLTESLYSGEAPVRSQSETDRLAASRTALAQALVKLSGDETLLGDPELSSALDRAPQMITQYAYRTEVEPGPGGQAVNNQYVELVFAKDSMERLLRQLNRPVWTTQRPGVVTWLIIEDGLNLRIASASQASALKALTRSARNRGLKLKLPVMDNVDLSRVDAFKVWRGEVNGVAAATPRYGEKNALIVRLNKTDTGWRARMSLLEKNKVVASWEESQSDAGAVLLGAGNVVANRMSERYAVSPEDLVEGVYRVEIAGLRNAEDYAGLIAHLKEVSVVTRFTPNEAEGDFLRGDLSLSVSLSRFAKVLAMAEKLKPLDDPEASTATAPPAESSAAPPVRYQWVN